MAPNCISQHFELMKMMGVDNVFLKKSPEFKAVDKTVGTVGTGTSEERLKQNFINYKDCNKCPLCHGRTNLVYGEGNPNADLMLIGEGPGFYEDKSGKPFVGKAGQLLTKMLLAIKIDRSQVYIGNIVKCRPPDNRDPKPEEVEACLPYLEEQIEIIKPRILLLLGRVAGQTLLKNNLRMQELRETEHTYKGIRTFVTYHPSALLRHTAWKKPAWIDLQKVQKIYEGLKPRS